MFRRYKQHAARAWSLPVCVSQWNGGGYQMNLWGKKVFLQKLNSRENVCLTPLPRMEQNREKAKMWSTTNMNLGEKEILENSLLRPQSPI